MACGIGLLITLVGLKGAGIIVADPVTLVKPGPLTPQVLLAAGGLALTVGSHGARHDRRVPRLHRCRHRGSLGASD